MGLWVHGSVGPWVHGFVNLCVPVSMGLWVRGLWVRGEKVGRWRPKNVWMVVYGSCYCKIIMYALCTREFPLCAGIMYGIMYGAAGPQNHDVRIMYGPAATTDIMYALYTRVFFLCTALCTGAACVMHGAGWLAGGLYSAMYRI